MSSTPENSNESYCTFTLAGDVTAGGLPSEADIRKDLEDNDPKVKIFYLFQWTHLLLESYKAIDSFYKFFF